MSHEQWIEEVKKALKLEHAPLFKKNIIHNEKIDAVSLGSSHNLYQSLAPRVSPFLTVQNYQDLNKFQMQDWIKSSAVGLRFRQLADVKQLTGDLHAVAKAAFLSQPFAFPLTSEDKEILQSTLKQVSYLNMGWSPSSFGLTRGEILKRPYKDWEVIFKDEALYDSRLRWFYLSSASFQWAGAEPHIEIAILIALAFDTLSELAEMGVTPEQVIPRITFGLSLGTDVLIESAKVTALKLVWLKLCEAYQSQVSVPSTEVFALPSLRYFSGRDPWNNIMRLTLMSFAAILGGAQGFKCIPYDVLRAKKEGEALRTSTNIPLLLTQEGFLDKVANPLDGSPLFESTVDILCREAWKAFQDIETKGGIFEAIRSGWLQSDIRQSAERSKEEVARLRNPILGVNKFVSQKVAEGVVVKLQDIIDPLFMKKNEDDFLSVEPLVVESLSYEWEKLQLAMDEFKNKNQSHPTVTVIKGAGPIFEKRKEWLQALLSLAPFNIDWKTLEDLKDSRFKTSNVVIVLPSSSELEAQILTLLHEKRVEKTWYVGPLKNEIAFDGYLEMTSNALEFLKQLKEDMVGA